MLDDPRLTPARPDLAAAHLKGAVEAERWAEPTSMRVSAPLAPMTGAPNAEAEMTTQLLFGEDVAVYEVEAGWAWAQCALDAYVGYLPEACLSAPGPAPSHRVVMLQTPVYPAPDLKTRPGGALPFGARVTAQRALSGYIRLAEGGWIPTRALAPLDAPAADWVAVAERMIGAPYLWGGRSPAGLDCSGIIQIALQAAGRDCPRDSDQQLAGLGAAAAEPLRRGDLVFWRRHVGIMTGPGRFLHANAHHMETVDEDFAEARARISALEGEILGIRRLDGQGGDAR